MNWPKPRRAVGPARVRGESMLPALRPGTWLLVLYGGRVAAGDVVVARPPGEAELLIVKRAAFRDGGGWWLESDNQAAPGRRDSWDYGAVPDDRVVGRVVWPLRLRADVTPP
ncbi:S24 family peptidase [Actinomadura flavalba]|uniref:S24 family peptidase n=1 Tax=Actinomadura flavalba TaxID=1120938 RepID=UPI00037487E3|nr:S24 family peptidase [Actinomadura flavalba]